MHSRASVQTNSEARGSSFLCERADGRGHLPLPEPAQRGEG